MKKLLYVVLAVVALPSLSRSVEAQMIPHYSVVHNWSTVWDNNNDVTVYSQFITEGYASGCCIPPSTTHQAVAYQSWSAPTNMSGINGGYVSGPRLCVTCHLYAESDGTATANNVSDPLNLDYFINEDDSGSVNCSIAGTFFNSDDIFNLEIAFTNPSIPALSRPQESIQTGPRTTYG